MPVELTINEDNGHVTAHAYDYEEYCKWQKEMLQFTIRGNSILIPYSYAWYCRGILVWVPCYTNRILWYARTEWRRHFIRPWYRVRNRWNTSPNVRENRKFILGCLNRWWAQSHLGVTEEEYDTLLEANISLTMSPSMGYSMFNHLNDIRYELLICKEGNRWLTEYHLPGWGCRLPLHCTGFGRSLLLDHPMYGYKYRLSRGCSSEVDAKNAEDALKDLVCKYVSQKKIIDYINSENVDSFRIGAALRRIPQST